MKEVWSFSDSTASMSVPPPNLKWLERGLRSLKATWAITLAIRPNSQCSEKTHPIPILHLIETGGPGGAERVLLDLAQHLGPGYHSIIGLLKPGWLQSQALSLGIPHVMVKDGGSSDLEVLAKLIQLVREHRISLIHAHEFYMSAMGAVVSRLTGIPLVVTVHGKGYYPERRRRCMVYRMVAGQAAGLIAVSKDLQRFFCQATGVQTNQVHIIYNGVGTAPSCYAKRDPNLLHPFGISLDSSIVGTLGNLYPVKGHVHLIRAAKSILRNRPNTHVIILGRGGLSDTLCAEAESLGIKNRIHLLGHCDEVPRWLAMMDVFTLPSLSEGLPISLLEAMASAVPTVVTEVGGMPEVVRDGQTGFLVPPEDPEALANKILFLLENSATAKQMGAAGQTRVYEQFSLEKMMSEYRDLYQTVLAGTSRKAV